MDIETIFVIGTVSPDGAVMTVDGESENIGTGT